MLHRCKIMLISSEILNCTMLVFNGCSFTLNGNIDRFKYLKYLVC